MVVFRSKSHLCLSRSFTIFNLKKKKFPTIVTCPPNNLDFNLEEQRRKQLIISFEKIATVGGKAYAAFIDFEKDFDSVDRALLLRKLYSQFGMEG